MSLRITGTHAICCGTCLRRFLDTGSHADQMAIVMAGDPPSLQRFIAPALNLQLTSGTVRGDCFLECSPQFFRISLVGYVIVVLIARVDSFDSVGLWVRVPPRTTGREGHG